MKLSELYTEDRPAISFELFPPKTDKGVKALEAKKEAFCLKKVIFLRVF